MKILMIDDNKKITEMFSQYFSLKGHEITIVNNGRNAVALIENTKFDRIILDIAMPEFTGFDVLENLIQHGTLKGNNIMILTAVPLSNADVNKLKKSGVCCILYKPAKMEVILKSLEDGCKDKS